MQLQREQQEYETSHKASIDELQKQYPDYFAPDEKDAEVTQSLNNGYEFVDKMLQMSEKFTVAERAAYNAVLRARAAGFLPTALKLKRAEGRVKELEDELTKYRDSDPGGGGEGGGGGEQTTKVGGIDAMASDFNKK